MLDTQLQGGKHSATHTDPSPRPKQGSGCVLWCHGGRTFRDQIREGGRHAQQKPNNDQQDSTPRRLIRAWWPPAARE
ncbi:hypothetical protein E2C01_097089 [Portunus trituberculatus]|uniref:Uncharacterized protein n=1 Tax=Portunus trituberculatus TaxID=210409 RepID=A0A5B7K4S2_PORTR|nr:hypothetical protein [Portunus trituberculatus]